MTAAVQIEKTFREEHGRALVTALERWEIDGVPRNPGAWLLTAAKRRHAATLERKVEVTAVSRPKREDGLEQRSSAPGEI